MGSESILAIFFSWIYLVPGGQSNCTVWTILICPCLPVMVFYFACKYSWAEINVKCIYQKWTLYVLCKTKQIKEKKFEISLKVNCIDFEVWPVNRRFCTRGWRPSKRMPPSNGIYMICEKLNKTAMWITPMGSNSAIVLMSWTISSLCYLVEVRSDWLVSSELDSWYWSLDARWSNET